MWYTEKEERRDFVSGYLEESDKLIKKRSRGYLSVSMFYIMGGLISLLTIIYLLVNK